ncbi:MAG: RtcB family protein [Caldilineaceae bacterium]|nr:RtcB family protein [Caldilineaceae bacterium]
MYQLVDNIPVWGEPLLDAVAQAVTVGKRADAVALMADHHIGYAMPIGGVAAYREQISPSGVGFDISCLKEGSLVTTAQGQRIPIEKVMDSGNLLGYANGRITNVGAALCIVSKQVEKTLELTLQSGDTLQLTEDHLLLTSTGWCTAGELSLDQSIAVSSYIGTETDQPVRHPLDYRLVRLFGYAVGDGHLAKEKNRVAFYTAQDNDALQILHDLRKLGYDNAMCHRRVRPNGSIENQIYCNSKQLHKLFTDWGRPPGIANWNYNQLAWLLDLPNYLKAAWLGGLFSAEMAAPVIRKGKLLGGAVMKQGGYNPLPLLHIVKALLQSLGYIGEIYPSGKPYKGRQCYQLLISGGQQQTIKVWRQIGFPYARYKQQKAAAAMSIIWQRNEVAAERTRAVELCRNLRQNGMGIYDLANAVSNTLRVNFTHSMALKAIYEERGQVRVPGGWIREPQLDGEFIWVPIQSLRELHKQVMVYDIPLAHHAHNFIANGIVAHNCGNKAVQLDVEASEVRPFIKTIMDDIWKHISFGVGRKNAEEVEHALFDDDPAWDIPAVRKHKQLAREQLGTVGSGNHYVDIFVDEQEKVWIGVHFGSRGLGHHIASHYIKAGGGKDGMNVEPVVLPVASPLGQEYIAAMQLAGRYAYAGRDWVCQKVAQIIGAPIVDEVHNHHNYAWIERHGEHDLWVVRKGATPAFPGQRSFVGGTMAEPAVILEGVDSEEAKAALYSTVHGAGRVMSRTRAAGKKKWIKGRPVTVQEGEVSRKMMMNWVREAGVELRGAGTDESPHCYKRLDEVLTYHRASVRIRHTLTPIGVAMAGENEFDPYKD